MLAIGLIMVQLVTFICSGFGLSLGPLLSFTVVITCVLI